MYAPVQEFPISSGSLPWLVTRTLELLKTSVGWWLVEEWARVGGE